MEPLSQEIRKLTVRIRLDTLGRITELIACSSAILKEVFLCLIVIYGRLGLVDF